MRQFHIVGTDTRSRSEVFNATVPGLNAGHAMKQVRKMPHHHPAIAYRCNVLPMKTDHLRRFT
jgi:hypothetical protein